MGYIKWSLWCLLPLIMILAGPPRHCRGMYFDVDEVLEALKHEIQTAQSMESGVPRLEIDKVELWLSVFSETSDKDAVELKIIGTDETSPPHPNSSVSHHTIYLSFNPNYFTDFTSEISSGLVETVSAAKASIKKTYLTSPNMTLNSFTFTINFAIMKKKTGVIHFVTTDLGRLKARAIPTHRLNIHMSIKTGNGWFAQKPRLFYCESYRLLTTIRTSAHQVHIDGSGTCGLQVTGEDSILWQDRCTRKDHHSCPILCKGSGWHARPMLHDASPPKALCNMVYVFVGPQFNK